MTTEELVRQPASYQLKADIINQIRSRQLCPGDPLKSASDLAKQYGIAYITAHKAIQELAKEGYCVRQPGKGTFVNDYQAAPEVSAVGIPAYFQSSSFHAKMVEELTFQAVMQGINAVVGRAQDTRGFIDRLVQANIKAMIRFPGHTIGAEDLDERGIWQVLKEREIATVVVNNFWYEDGPFPNVRVDEQAGISMMMDHLIGLGHRKIFLVGETVSGARYHAMEAYRQAMLRHDLPYDPRNIVFLCPPHWEQAIAPMAQRMVEQSTASIVLYDMYAVGLHEELCRMGVVPGKDYSIASFEGTPEAEACDMTVVQQPLAKLVATAYSLLSEADQKAPRTVLVKPDCIIRASTGPVAGHRKTSDG